MANFRTSGAITEKNQKAGNMSDYAYVVDTGGETSGSNRGQSASRSLYSTFANMNDTAMTSRDLLQSRLWYGVPQLTEEQIAMFDAAYTGHTRDLHTMRRCWYRDIPHG